MRPLVLSLRHRPDQRLDLSPLLPHRWPAGRSRKSSRRRSTRRGIVSRSAMYFGCGPETPSKSGSRGRAIVSTLSDMACAAAKSSSMATSGSKPVD